MGVDQRNSPSRAESGKVVVPVCTREDSSVNYKVGYRRHLPPASRIDPRPSRCYFPDCSSHAPITASSTASAFPFSRSATTIMCFAKRFGTEKVSGKD